MFFNMVVKAVLLLGFGEMGDEPPHRPGPCLFLEKSGRADHREAAPADSGRKLGVKPLGVGNLGGGV